MLIRKPPFRVIQLGGGHAQVQQDPVHLREIQPLEQLRHIPKVAMHQGHPFHPGRQPLLGGVQRRLISVDGDEPSGSQAFRDRSAVAGAA